MVMKMYKVFNTQAITRNQRFNRAIIFGSLASLGCSLVYGLVSSMLHIDFAIFHMVIGYVIGGVIKEYGRGVQPRFSILGACLCALSIFLGDIIGRYGFGIFMMPQLYGVVIVGYLRSLLSTNFNSLLGLLFRVEGIYLAYKNSRVV